MHQEPDSSQPWVPCPPGSLSRFSAKHRKHITRRAAQVWLGLGMCLGLCAGLAWLGWSSMATYSTQPNAVGQHWGCRAVLAHIDDYFGDGMSAESKSKIDQHLAHCRHCHERYRQRADELGLESTIAVLVPLLPAAGDLFPIALQGWTFR